MLGQTTQLPPSTGCARAAHRFVADDSSLGDSGPQYWTHLRTRQARRRLSSSWQAMMFTVLVGSPVHAHTAPMTPTCVAHSDHCCGSFLPGEPWCHLFRIVAHTRADFFPILLPSSAPHEFGRDCCYLHFFFGVASPLTRP